MRSEEMREAAETARLAKLTCERLMREYARVDGSVAPPVISWAIDGDTLLIIAMTSNGPQPFVMPLSYVDLSEPLLREQLMRRISAAWTNTKSMTRLSAP